MNIIVDQIWPHVAAGLPSYPVNGKTSQILFLVPWRNKTMIGTWHIPWNDVPSAFTINESVIQDFIDEINSAHPPLKLSLDDVQHVTWGFLPVNKEDANRDQVKLTRDGVVIDHQKKDGVSSLISVLGVKYTTARAVAEQAVDLAVAKLSLITKPCQTHIQSVKGGQIADFQSFLNQAVADAHGIIDMQIIEHLVYNYGSEYCKLEEKNLTRIDPKLPVTEAEVIHAVRAEMASALLDVIQRRTEMGAAGLPSMTTLQKCAELMGRELSWTIERQRQEIDSVVHAYSFNGMQRVTA
jgi:glycerol-3-phosphate dehydrogenase